MARITSLLIILLLMLTGCGEKALQSGNGSGSNFSICLGIFNGKVSAERFAENIKKNAPKNRAIQKISVIVPDTSKKSKEYTVEIEGFPTSLSAGMAAYSLYQEKVITDYTITHNRLPVYDEFANIFFVGESRKKPAVFTYNLKSGKYKVFWSSAREIVIELSSSKDGRSVFFLTASDFGRKTIFPHVNNLKLYRLDLASMRVEKLKNLGNAVQIFSKWETPGSFKVIYNAFDAKRSTFVNQTTLLYTTNGKMLKNEKVVYDITKEKYPVPHFLYRNLSSVNKNSEIAVTSSNNQNYLSVVDSLKARKIIHTTSQTFNSVDWWRNGDCIVFSTYDVSPSNKTIYSKNPQTSDLYVYLLSKSKILLNWKGAGYKNFLLRGDLLFFDDGFNKDSKIMVYDLKNNYIMDTIAVRGGCGINNIPIIPY